MTLKNHGKAPVSRHSFVEAFQQVFVTVNGEHRPLLLLSALEGFFLCLHGFDGGAHRGPTKVIQIRVRKQAKLGNFLVDEFALCAHKCCPLFSRREHEELSVAVCHGIGRRL
jgi:hypothetical protein